MNELSSSNHPNNISSIVDHTISILDYSFVTVEADHRLSVLMGMGNTLGMGHLFTQYPLLFLDKPNYLSMKSFELVLHNLSLTVPLPIDLVPYNVSVSG